MNLWQRGLSLWDVCAPDAISKGVGGFSTDMVGRPINYHKDNIKVPGLIHARSKPMHEHIMSKMGP
jgi:fructose-1,6-bisphosphatase/inositol monophosphatase family enzyme